MGYLRRYDDAAGMFFGASSFNQDIGGWAVHKVSSQQTAPLIEQEAGMNHMFPVPRRSTRTWAGAWTTA